MSPAVWICIFLPLFLVLLNEQQQKKRWITLQKRKKKERPTMHEFIKDYLGQECIIYLGLGSQVTGVIEQESDGWITVTSGENRQSVNLDYVTRVRLYPRDKNGKKKTFYAD